MRIRRAAQKPMLKYKIPEVHDCVLYGISATLKRKMRGRATKRKEETAPDNAARITAAATKWMAVFTFVLMLCTAGTLLLLDGQLREMHEGGADTHTLAVSAGQQAVAAKALAEESKAQVLKMDESLAKTDALIQTAARQAIATDKLAREAARSADIARNSLVSTQRAYLSFGDVEQVLSGVKIHLTNFGHVPARIINESVNYSRQTYPQNQFVDRRAVHIEYGEINPGSASEFALMVFLPRLEENDQVAVSNGSQRLVINAFMTFDCGFNSTDRFEIHAMFDPSEKRWVHMTTVTLVDLPGAPNTVRQPDGQNPN
jgi:hypothetical protein